MTAPVLHRRTGEVVANRPLGSYRQVSVVLPSLPGPTRPGQFLIGPPEEADRVLPRTWWVAGEHTEKGFGSTLDLVVPDGAVPDLPQVGDRLALTGPVGRGYGVPTAPVTAVVATEGAAGAAARWLCDRLRAAGCRTHLVSVAPDPDLHVDLVRARRSADEVVLVEPDDVARALHRVASDRVASVLYAVGPVPLSATVARVAAEVGVVSQVAGVEIGPTVSSVCGHGLCGGCDLPIAGRREAWVRPCSEGPVVRGDVVDWVGIP